jgi:hypothetical protein
MKTIPLIAGHDAYQERTPYPLPVVILHPEKV